MNKPVIFDTRAEAEACARELRRFGLKVCVLPYGKDQWEVYQDVTLR
jgi:hypothetical protein